jgi:hypothetical protein
VLDGRIRVAPRGKVAPQWAKAEVQLRLSARASSARSSFGILLEPSIQGIGQNMRDAAVTS